MPELPEVETVRRSLEAKVKGKRIETAHVDYPPMLEGALERFHSTISGRVIEDVKRRGKYLLFDLAGVYLLSHLRMEGKYFLTDREEKKQLHERARIFFTDRTALLYEDVRKFGTFALRDAETVFTTRPLSKLGYEPFDASLTPALFHGMLKGRRAIKSVLLDQRVVAGIGNIYADEILFCAGVHPMEEARTLEETQASRIHACFQRILESAIDAGGASVRTYKNTLGTDGRFERELCVHTKAGTPCPHCSTPIEKIKVNGRGTYFCPHCQRRGKKG